MTTIISPNIKKVSERIDPQGNVIDPRTKQIIQKNEQDYVPSPEQLAQVSPEATKPSVSVVTQQDTPKSIQEEINATKAKLAELEEKKKAKIEDMKRELEELEA